MTTINVWGEGATSLGGMPTNLKGFSADPQQIANGKLATFSPVLAVTNAVNHVGAVRVIQGPQIAMGAGRFELAQPTFPVLLDLAKDWLPPFAKKCDIHLLISTDDNTINDFTVYAWTAEGGITAGHNIPSTSTPHLSNATWVIIPNVLYGLGTSYMGVANDSIRLGFDGSDLGSAYLYAVKMFFPGETTIEV